MKGTAQVSQPNGFTLLELLVALIVFGVLLTGLAHGIHLGLIAWATEARLTSGNDDLNTLNSTLRHLIEDAGPGDDFDTVPFSGSRNRLACITTLPSAGAPTGERRVQAVLLVDAERRLVLRWRPYLHAKLLRPPLSPLETELLRDVSGMELAFWRPGVGWVSSWRSPELPTLVRVRLKFPIGDPRHWPEIVAAPWLDRP